VYKDPIRAAHALNKLRLRSGATTLAKVELKAKGVSVPPLGSLTLPLRVQVQRDQGTCFEASFGLTGVIRNDAGQFKGKAE
jgi:hypothetical protein